MIGRRGFLSFLAGFPFLSGVLSSSLAEAWAETPEKEFGNDVRYVRGVYAYEGDILYCEKGHVVGYVQWTVRVGDPFDDKALYFGNPDQRPKIGQDNHGCLKCGARWYKGPYFRFGDGWRIGLG